MRKRKVTSTEIKVALAKYHPKDFFISARAAGAFDLRILEQMKKGEGDNCTIDEMLEE